MGRISQADRNIKKRNIAVTATLIALIVFLGFSSSFRAHLRDFAHGIHDGFVDGRG